MEYTVVCRSGNWRNASWHTADGGSMDEAKRQRREIEAQGFKAFIWKARHVDSAGLPIGFCRHADPLTGRMDIKECKCD